MHLGLALSHMPTLGISNVRQTMLAFLLAPLLSLQSWTENTVQSLQTKSRSGIAEGVVIDMIIAFLLVAILFPIAQAQIVSATTTLWNQSVITMFAVLLPILVITDWFQRSGGR